MVYYMSQQRHAVINQVMVGEQRLFSALKNVNL
jgi:hypothetical protein